MSKRKNESTTKDDTAMKDRNWVQEAFKGGYILGTHFKINETENAHYEINKIWNYWASDIGFRTDHLDLYVSVTESFLKGYSYAVQWKFEDKLLMPTSKEIAAVLAVQDEEDTLPEVLHQLQRLPLCELIVIVNGSKDNSYNIAKKVKKAKIAEYPHSLGHDVGRAIGAKLAESEVVLFIDGDLTFTAEQLLPFFHSIEMNNDVVLNDISPYIGPFSEWDAVTIMKEFLNRVLLRPDLKMNSLTAVPNVLTKKAIKEIGYENLAVPPLAQALAIQKGLSIEAVVGVDVIHGNKIRKTNVGTQNPVAELIIGDHIEALSTLMESQGKRLSFKDHIRDRSIVTKLGLYHL